MNYKDYYGELGIQKNATPAEIKKAYRKFANKYHPDKTNGDKSAEEKFKAINEANEVLSDPEKRKKYDQFGADWKQYEAAGAQPGGFDWSKYSSQQAGQSGRTGSDPFDGMFTNDNTGDLFEMLFGQRGGSQRRSKRGAAAKGDDLAAETTLSLDEVYNGTARLLQLDSQTIKVTLKPGVADNQKLRIPGKGRRGSNGGQNGDLFLTVRIASHSTFRRSEDDLSCTLLVKLYTAVLGGKVQLGTFKGNLNIDIPAGTPNGKVLKLRGMGMPVYAKKNEFGNMLVKIEIVLPGPLSDEETDLFRKLAAFQK